MATGVIRILSRILHDVVKGTCQERGICWAHRRETISCSSLPVDLVQETCAEIVRDVSMP